MKIQMRLRRYPNILLVLLALAILSSPISYAEELEPFESWIQKRPDWSSDVTEFAYATTRCGTLFLVIGGVFVENPASQENVKQGNELRGRGFALQMFGSRIAESKGMNQESQLERAKLLYKSYAERIVTNRRLHNNMFHGWMLGDFKFCTDLEKNIRDFADEYTKRNS